MFQQIVDFCQLYLDDIITKDTRFQLMNIWPYDLQMIFVIKEGEIILLNKYSIFSKYTRRCEDSNTDLNQALIELHHALFPDVDVNFESVLEINN